MTEHERDQELLALLHPIGRARLEGMVQEFIRTELPAETPIWLREAADMFEDSGVVMHPPPERLTGLLFAAALRERAAALLH